jgi:predicted PurR-regulated permease PerM
MSKISGKMENLLEYTDNDFKMSEFWIKDRLSSLTLWFHLNRLFSRVLKMVVMRRIVFCLVLCSMFSFCVWKSLQNLIESMKNSIDNFHFIFFKLTRNSSQFQSTENTYAYRVNPKHANLTLVRSKVDNSLQLLQLFIYKDLPNFFVSFLVIPDFNLIIVLLHRSRCTLKTTTWKWCSSTSVLVFASWQKFARWLWNG